MYYDANGEVLQKGETVRVLFDFANTKHPTLPRNLRVGEAIQIGSMRSSYPFLIKGEMQACPAIKYIIIRGGAPSFEYIPCHCVSKAQGFTYICGRKRCICDFYTLEVEGCQCGHVAR